MFKKIQKEIGYLAILIAVCVSVAYATPPVAVDDAFTIDIDDVVNSTNFGNVFLNDTDVDNDISSVDTETGAPGYQYIYYYNAPSSYSEYVYDNGGGTLGFTLGRQAISALLNIVFPHHVYDAANEESNVAQAAYTITDNTPMQVTDEYATTTEDIALQTGVYLYDNVTKNGNSYNEYGTDYDVDIALPGVQNTFSDAQGVVGTGSYGEIAFTPTSGFIGIATYQYQAQDYYGYRSNIATVHIAVVPNVPPVTMDDTMGNVEPSATKTFLILNNDADTENYSFTDTDVDLDTSTPTYEQVFIDTLGTWTFSSGELSFVAGATQGVETLQYKIKDGAGNESNISTVTIQVIPNQAPVANDDVYPVSIYEGNTATFCPRIQDNDIDGEDASLSYLTIDLDPSTPSVEQYIEKTEGEWYVTYSYTIGCGVDYMLNFYPRETYSPAYSVFLGTATTTYTIRDSAGLVSNEATISVTYTHQPPSTNDDNVIGGINNSIEVSLLNNDNAYGVATLVNADLEPGIAGTQSTATRAWGNYIFSTITKKVTFTPTTNFIGATTLPYIAIDSLGATSTPANINISVQNIPVIEMSGGFVGTNNANSFFAPSTTGPVTVAPYGTACSARLGGTVNSTQLAGQTFNSDIKKGAINDIITHVTVLENTGSVDAFDLTLEIRDPAYGLGVLGACVISGNGTVLTEGVDYYGTDYFQFNVTQNGIIDAHDASSGNNIIIIIQDYQFYNYNGASFSDELQSFVRASLYAYSDAPSGSSFVNYPEPQTYSAIQIGDEADASVRVTSSLLSSSQTNTLPTQVTIGELLTYRVEFQVPPLGTTSTATSTQRLSPGMVFYDANGTLPTIATITYPSFIEEDSFSGGQPLNVIQTLINPQTLDINLGSLRNTTTTPQIITVEYSAIVLDALANTRFPFSQTNNDPSFSVFGGIQSVFTGSSTMNTIVEPSLVVRSVSATSTSATTAQFIYELFHDGSNISDAQDVTFFLQTNGAGLTPITISNPVTGGLPAATTTIGSLLLSWHTIPSTYTSSSPITIAFTGTLATPVTGTTTLSYPVGLYSGSVPGASSMPLSSLSPLSHGRLYTSSSSLPITFAPGGAVVPPATSTPPCAGGSCGGGYSNPGCMDPKALNYDKWATVENNTCKYPSVVNPVSTTTPPTAVTPSTPTPVLKVEPTYIPKNKLKKLLEITGNPRTILNTKIRSTAIILAKSQGNTLAIPSLKVFQPILQLPSLDALLGETWILPDNSTPDKAGNTVIVAHSYSDRGGKKTKSTLFDLVDVQIGEKLEVAWKGKTYVYEVFDNDQFSPEDIWLEDDTKESILTIYSCGRFTTKYRQVVRASLVEIK